MTELSIEAYVVRAGLALYPLLYEDAPFPESKLKAQAFGPFADTIEAVRNLHAARLEQTGKTGTIYDVYGEARMLWEGLRANDSGKGRLGLLDDEIKKLAWSLEKNTPAPAPQPATNGTKPHTEYAAVPKMPIDVNDLLVMERKPTIWYAPSFVREGLGLLVGQPNVGKTPAAIQLAIAIATGRHWLNTVLCRRAKVLYLGMEYSPQELIPMFDISRMGQDIPRDWLLVKTIEDEFPTDAAAALDELEWYLRVMDVRVIIIDVLTAFLPPEKFKQNVYRGDYSELKPYHRLALHYNAAILGVWHASKRESDPKIMYNGSTGMWAAAASRIAMYQDQEQRVRISSFPRMGDRVDWALTQEKNNAGRRWVLADAAPEPICSPAELQVFRFLKEHADKTKPLSPATIAELTGMPPGSVRSHVSRMFEQNILQRLGNGYYVEDVAPVAPVADVTGVALVADVMLHLEPEVQHDFNGLESPIEGVQQVQRHNTYNDESTPLVFQRVPPSKVTNLRLYLRSNKEKDQERAQELCEEYGIDYDEARKAVT